MMIDVEWALFEDLAMSEETGLDTYDRNDLVELWQHLEAYKLVVNAAHRKVQDALAKILDTPEVLSDGRVLKATRAATRTGWQKRLLADEIIRVHGKIYVDPDSGEGVKLLGHSELVGLFDPTTAVTKLKNAGVDYKKFCTEDWRDALEIIK